MAVLAIQRVQVRNSLAGGFVHISSSSSQDEELTDAEDFAGTVLECARGLLCRSLFEVSVHTRRKTSSKQGLIDQVNTLYATSYAIRRIRQHISVGFSIESIRFENNIDVKMQ